MMAVKGEDFDTIGEKKHERCSGNMNKWEKRIKFNEHCILNELFSLILESTRNKILFSPDKLYLYELGLYLFNDWSILIF